MTTYASHLQEDFLIRLKEASDFFKASGKVYKTLQNLILKLEKEYINVVLLLHIQ